MDESAADTLVEWRSWGADAFAAAEREDRPLLLSLSANWCDWCRRMDETTYADPGVAATIHDGFVPVRVDVDRRPRVRERYNAGGFPSTVFATPGGEVVSGATFLDPDAMRGVLERMREVWADRGTDAGRVPRALRETGTPAGEVTGEIEELVAGQLEEQFDAAHAGWGTDAKFPLPSTTEFALKRSRPEALATLDAVRNALCDECDGGFFRYAGERDWSDVRREKLLDENAALLRAYANAYLHTGEDDYRAPAESARDYLVETLWTGEAFGGSQAPGDYYDQPPGEREAADPPPVDETAFADRNALAADALCTYHAYTDDETALEYADRALDFLADRLVGEDGVVAHYDAPGAPRCLLADQARVAGAFATAAQVTDPSRAEVARRVADAALDRLRDGDAFVDAPTGDVGLLDRSLTPVDDNAAMADALVDLRHLAGVERYADVARDAVAAFAGAADRFGPQVAAYATAAARVHEPPLRIRVATDPGSDLHRAALRVADHEKVVVPDADGDGVERGSARVLAGGERSAPATTPAELSERVAEHAE